MDFAVRLGKSKKPVSQLVNGKASLTHKTGIELERGLGVPSSFWNATEARTEWAGSFPLKEMVKQGFIAQDAGPAEVLDYFGVSSVDAYNDHRDAPRRLANRMSTAYTAYTADTPAIAAWQTSVLASAKTVGIAPGIVVEQLQKDAIVPYRQMNDLKEPPD